MRVLRVDGRLGQGCGRLAALKAVAATAWTRGSWTGDRMALFGLGLGDGFDFRRWM